jgi:hypothetical protein
VPPQPVVPSPPARQDSTELQVREEYRRTVHNSLQNLLAKDIQRSRSIIDVKHKGASLIITLFFNDQGKLENAIVSKPSKFERLDQYYLKLIKRLVDRGDFPAPPIEQFTTTVVTIPIDLK